MTVPTDLDQRFRDAATREGLVDVAYDLADSPVGELLVAVTDRGLCRIAYRPDDALDEIANDFGAGSRASAASWTSTSMAGAANSTSSST
jgi:hypothetical protein